MPLNNSKGDFDQVPPQIVDIIHQYILGLHVDNFDLHKAHLRKSVVKILTFVLFMYATLIAVGVFSNLAVLIHIVRYKLYDDPTYAFIINNVISDVLKCVCVLPLSLYVLLMQNWVLGELLCSFLPMLQVR